MIVGVAGAGGRMGRLVAEAVDAGPSDALLDDRRDAEAEARRREAATE